MKTVNVMVRGNTWPLGAAPPLRLLALSGPRQVAIADVLREVSLRTAPPLSQGFSLSDCWAWLRYGPALDDGVGLRLRPEWADLDPHQKTIFSDDWGVGLSMHLLDVALGFSRVTTTSYFLSQTPQAGWLLKSGKRGPYKCPDFIAEDANGVLHVVECKGTQSDPSVLDNQVANGKPQKRNIRFAAHLPVGQRLVAGCFVPQFSSQFDAVVVIEDPPEHPESPLVDLSFEAVEEIIVRGELASTLRIARLPKLANRVALNARSGAKSDADVVRELGLLTDGSTDGRPTKMWRTVESFAYQVERRLVSKFLTVEVSLSQDTIDTALDPHVKLATRFPRTVKERYEVSPGRVTARTPMGLAFTLGLEG